MSRSVGINGCRLSAVLGEEVIGYIETEILDEGERMWRHGGWADVGNLRVAAPYRRRGVGSWLLGQAADWLRLAQVTRLLDYAWLEGTDPARAELRRLPGLPARRGLPRADPHRARVDQGALNRRRRRSSGRRWVTPARSRYSSSGIATRRVVPSACLASAVVNGCGSRASTAAAGLRVRGQHDLLGHPQQQAGPRRGRDGP